MSLLDSSNPFLFKNIQGAGGVSPVEAPKTQGAQGNEGANKNDVSIMNFKMQDIQGKTAFGDDYKGTTSGFDTLEITSKKDATNPVTSQDKTAQAEKPGEKKTDDKKKTDEKKKAENHKDKSEQDKSKDGAGGSALAGMGASSGMNGSTFGAFSLASSSDEEGSEEASSQSTKAASFGTYEENSELKEIADKLKSKGVNCVDDKGQVDESKVRAALNSLNPKELLQFNERQLGIIEQNRLVDSSKFKTEGADVGAEV